MHSIVDFCVKWRKLSRLQLIRKENNLTGDVIWEKWNKKSESSCYTMKFHGIKIDQPNTFEGIIKRESSSNPKIFNDTIGNQEIQQSLQWQIWFNAIDPYVNLQWGSCSKTYWFTWLMNWMLEWSTWPNWRINLTKSIVHPNRDWKNFAEILMNGSMKKRDYLWNEHKEESSLFCLNWDWYIWAKWIINQRHYKHKLVESKLISDILQKQANKLLETSDVVINSCQNNFEYLESNLEVKEKIVKDVYEPLIRSLNEAWKELNGQNNNMEVLNKQLLDIQRDKSQSMVLIKYYCDSKDPSLMPRFSKALKEVDNLNLKASSLSLSLKIEEKKFDIQKIFDDEFEITFSVPLKKLACQDETCVIFKNKIGHFAQLFLCKSEDDTIGISLSFDEKYQSKYYLKIELEKNMFCKLLSKNVKEFDLWKEPKIVNRIKLVSKIKTNNNSKKLNFKVNFWRTCEKTEEYKNDIYNYILNKLKSHNEKEESNNLYEDSNSSIDTELKESSACFKYRPERVKVEPSDESDKESIEVKLEHSDDEKHSKNKFNKKS